MVKQFASFYFPGTHGSWLVWFINQHKNFPKEELGILQTYYHEGDTENDYQERNGGSVVCNEYNDYTYHYEKDSDGNEFPITDFTCVHSDWHYYFQSFGWFMGERFDYESGATKLCFKVLDHHFPIFAGPYENGEDEYGTLYEDDQYQVINNQRKTLSQILLESNASGIIIPMIKDTLRNELIGRYNIIRAGAPTEEILKTEEHILNKSLPLLTKDSRRIRKIYDIPDLTFEKVINKPLLFVDIGKIITCDEEEYNRLLDFIGEEAIPCWKDIINNTVMKVYKINKLL
tara:strand:- start:4066 stop:4929 length:864 start_codon:yes stop_codon:yes gene_type:complete